MTSVRVFGAFVGVGVAVAVEIFPFFFFVLVAVRTRSVSTTLKIAVLAESWTERRGGGEEEDGER